MEDEMLKILMKYIENQNTALNARKELLGLFRVMASNLVDGGFQLSSETFNPEYLADFSETYLKEYNKEYDKLKNVEL